MNGTNKRDTWLNLVFSLQKSQAARQKDKGQAVVEFTLIFILFLIVAWIPADFGLAFLTGQLAQNASREGARIAAADPCLMGVTISPATSSPSVPCLISTATAQPVSCTLGSCPNDDSVLGATARRLSYAFLPGAQINLTFTTCTPPAAWLPNIDHVIVTVDGDYNYFFLGLLGWLGLPAPASQDIVRTTEMQWEHRVCS